MGRQNGETYAGRALSPAAKHVAQLRLTPYIAAQSNGTWTHENSTALNMATIDKLEAEARIEGTMSKG